MNRVSVLVLLIAGLSWGVARPCAAQEALVLGGGGSRGLAHGGVVVGLERLGRDPELVVGTSMGAVIGALYAAGYAPARIWNIVAGEDWPALFTPVAWVVGPDREPREPLLALGADATPSGLVPDWRINRRLVRLLFEAQARSRGDFDRLPRRFRAVAASLETGGAVVPAEGDLALAVRASMAVPGVFAPVRWNGEWLVDGGIRDNLPVAVARALGAEHVVAVDVIRPPPALEETDPLSIGLRGLRLLLTNAVPDTAADELVLPRIPPEFPEAIFPRDPQPLLRAGLEATLETLAADARRAPRRSPLPPPAAVGALEVVGGDPAIRALARAAFGDVAPGRFDPDAVLDAVDRLYATGLFTGVWPSIRPAVGDSGPEYATTTAAPRLLLQLATIERTLLAGAAGYDNDRGGRLWAAFRHRVSLGAPAELGVEASGDRLERWAVVSARLFSIRHPPLAWSLGGGFREADVRRFVNDDVEGETRVRRTGGWAGAELRWVAPELAAALLLRGERIAVEAGDDGMAWGPLLRVGGVESAVRVVGRAPLFEAEARWGAFDYRRVRAGGSVDGRLGRLRLAAAADAAHTAGNAPPDALPALGDDRLMPGLEWGEMRGRTRVVGGVDVAYPIPFEGFVRLRLRGGAVDDPLDRPGAGALGLAGAELGAIWPTPAGRLLLAVGAATDGGWRVHVNVGPLF
ncbi:MAG TPA: patatin-like phospholipase family protein [Longimicrobiales bacterium]